MCFIVPQEDSARNRAQQILWLADEGRSIKEIAHDLFLAERTVIQYLRQIVTILPFSQTRAAMALLATLKSEVSHE